MNYGYQQICQQPYPIHTLPDIVQDFVLKVAYQTQTTPSHAATVAMSSIAAVVQGLIDVRHPHGAISPTSMYTWIVARSGERKSSISNLINLEIENHEAAGMTNIDEERNEANSSRAGQATSSSQAQFWFEDATSSSITEAMTKGSKNVFCSTDEGGILLKYLDLPTYCKWWDGSPIRYNRKDKPPALLRGCKVSLCIQIQDIAFERIMKNKGEQFLESGFLARTLFIRPESFQGMRQYLTQTSGFDMNSHPFHLRMRELLQANKLNNQNRNENQTAELDFHAIHIWKNFCDEVESGLRPEGYYSDIPMFANRAGHMAVRLAAALQFFAQSCLTIGEIAMSSACTIVRWHLQEAKITFGKTPEGYETSRDAQKLYAWLCKAQFNGGISNKIPKSQILRFGPAEVRTKDRLNPAIDYLFNYGLITAIQANRTTYIQISEFTDFTNKLLQPRMGII